MAVSELADRRLRERRAWAASGSSHDYVIRFARIALPLAIAALVMALALAPLTVGKDISFVLSKDRVDVARERMRVTKAAYRGDDSKGRAFQLTAASAVQTSSRDPIVRLSEMVATIQMPDGPAFLRAGQGRYDMTNENIAIDGPVRFDEAGGYRVVTRDVTLDMKTRMLASQKPIDGTMPLGRFTADRLRANLDTRVIDLDGRVRLHIVQGRSRGPR